MSRHPRQKRPVLGPADVLIWSIPALAVALAGLGKFAGWG